MFDISWSELLILAVVTLIFVGPKELPKFLGTLGRYAAVVRRQANEFRRIFDEAMREAELQELKKNVDDIRNDVTSSFRDVQNQTSSAMNTDVVKPSAPKTTASETPDTAPAETETTIADAPKPESLPEASATEPETQAEPAPQPIAFPLASPANEPEAEPVPVDRKAGGGS
jgi:sec-independent protein translocase protein TatB